MKKAFLFIMSGIVLISCVSMAGRALADSNIDRANRFIKTRSTFTNNERKVLTGRLEYAIWHGLPVESLINRITEGVAKRKRFSEVLLVVDKKIDQFQTAARLLEGLDIEGLVEDREYSIHVLSEVLEMGYDEHDFGDLSGLCLLRRIRSEEILELVKLQIDLEREGVSLAESKQVITAAMIKRIRPYDIKGALAILKIAKAEDADFKHVKEIIMRGIEKRDMSFIRDRLRNVVPEEDVPPANPRDKARKDIKKRDGGGRRGR